MKCIAACVLMMAASQANAFSVSCALGAKCIKSQGTSIPSKQVIEMMEYCDDFTRGSIGRSVLRMSLHEINTRSDGNITHPIFSAHYAFDQLRDSPLKFDRKASVDETSYEQIAHSCRQLNIDFNRWIEK